MKNSALLLPLIPLIIFLGALLIAWVRSACPGLPRSWRRPLCWLMADNMAREIATSFREHPNLWRTQDPRFGHEDHYKVHHASGLSIWVANQGYGLHLEGRVDGRVIPRRYEIGAGATPSQNLIWFAYMNWRDHYAGERSAVGAFQAAEARLAQQAPPPPPLPPPIPSVDILRETKKNKVKVRRAIDLAD
jgi:hypothetical protein